MVAAVSVRFVKWGLEFHNLKDGFSVFGFRIAYYGVIIAIGMLLAMTLVFWEAKRTGQKVDDYYDLAIIVLIAGVIGARIYYVAFEWSTYKDDLLSVFNIRNGGLGIYGGVLAGLLSCYVFTRIRKLSYLQMVDTAVLGLIVGQIIGRWGNFVNREAFGGYTNNFFAMQIKLDEVGGVISDSVANHIKVVDGIQYIQVHPTFLYESLWNLVILILILIFRKYKKFEGQIMCWYMIGYGVGRFFIEGLRTDQLVVPGIHIAISQIVSVGMVLFGIGFWLYKENVFKKIRKHTQEEIN